jgi:hypothetical protein
MSDKIDINRFLSWMDWLYDQAIKGNNYFDSSQSLADSYLALSSSATDAASSLINWESAKSASCGVVTTLGGVITLPVTLPISVTSNLFIQIRMIAAVAIIGGHSAHDVRIRNLAYLCIGGSFAKDLLKSLYTHFFGQVINEFAIKQVQQQVLSHLMTNTTTKQAAGASRLLPFIGGLLNGALDGITTYAAGRLACEIFIS